MFEPQTGVQTLAQDCLFAALDGQALRIGDREWRLRVYGVIDLADRRWVQLEIDGDRPQVLTLRLGPFEGPQQAVHTLSTWLANPTTEQRDVLSYVA